MYKTIQAKVTSTFPEAINTDDIIPAPVLLETWERQKYAKHAFEKYDPRFIERCSKGPNVIVAGPNFGCGSSREQAVDAIVHNNVKFIVAQKDPQTGTAYPDIFYRNALNNGLPLVAIDDVSKINLNDILKLDLEKRKIYNITQDTKYDFEIPETDAKFLREGGSTPLAKADLERRLKPQE